MDTDRYNIAIEAVRACGDLLLREAGKFDDVAEFAHDVKLSQDRSSEAIILAAIERSFPGDGFLSEERGAKNSSSGFHWVIDPLDGTMNYFRNIPQSCISVACLDRGEHIIGIVYDFLKDELFTAQQGTGAFLNEKPIRVSSVATLGKATIAYGLMKGEEEIRIGMEFLSSFVPRVRKVRLMGAAALDLCYVACGRFDLFVEFNLKPWDTAAGRLIITEAGGDYREEPFGELTKNLATNGILTL